MYQVEGYWKVRLVCLITLAIFLVVFFINNSTKNSSREVNKISCAIVCVDRLGIAS